MLRGDGFDGDFPDEDLRVLEFIEKYPDLREMPPVPGALRPDHPDTVAEGAQGRAAGRSALEVEAQLGEGIGSGTAAGAPEIPAALIRRGSRGSPYRR